MWTWVESRGYEQRGLPPPLPALSKLFLSSKALIPGYKGSHNSIINNNQYKIQRLLSRVHLWVLSYDPLFLNLDPFLVLTDLVSPQDIKFLVSVLWKIYLVIHGCLWHLNDFLPCIPQYRLGVRSVSFPYSPSPLVHALPPFPPSHWELSFRQARFEILNNSLISRSKLSRGLVSNPTVPGLFSSCHWESQMKLSVLPACFYLTRWI